MNFNLTALRATLFVLLTIGWCNSNNANSPDYPNIDDDLGKLLIEGMGGLMNENPDYPTFTDDHYRARFLEMSGEIQYRLTTDIKNHIIHRTERYRSATERTLGLTEMYFPIFEEYLAAKNIPHHLKYLPIVESNLNAVAKSHAAAVGLWQFIPGTGKLYGLKVVSYLDERSDTHKASNAAATMLANLYKRYGDWPLALAAYNCGPGRVDKYVKGNDKDFWDIRKYLPRETQMYVPYFMAVAYSYEFHHLHELKPKRLPADLVLTDSIHLEPGYQTLSQLSKKYKIDKDTLKRLNPGYIKNYVPSSSKNSILVLPARIVAKVRNYEPAFKKVMSMKTKNPIKCIRRINTEADLGKMMKAHRFSRQDLLFWNGLPSNYRVKQGDIIAIRKYRVPKDAWQKKKEVRKSIKGIAIASLKVVGLDDEKKRALTAPVYVNIKKKKLSNRIVASTAGPTYKGNKSNMGIAPTKSNPYASKKGTATSTQKIKKDEVITAISQNRSRERRLRNNSQAKLSITSTNKTTQNRTTKSISPEPIKIDSEKRKAEDAAARKASATKQVSQLSQSIQSKEQAVIKAKTYSPTSAEEVTTLSYLNEMSKTLKKERMTKKKDREVTDAKAKELKAKQDAEMKAKAAEKLKAKQENEKQELATTYQYHVVKENERLWDIEKQYKGVSIRNIMLLNNISTDTILRKGMKLKIRVQ